MSKFKKILILMCMSILTVSAEIPEEQAWNYYLKLSPTASMSMLEFVEKLSTEIQNEDKQDRKKELMNWYAISIATGLKHGLRQGTAEEINRLYQNFSTTYKNNFISDSPHPYLIHMSSIYDHLKSKTQPHQFLNLFIFTFDQLGYQRNHPTLAEGILAYTTRYYSLDAFLIDLESLNLLSLDPKQKELYRSFLENTNNSKKTLESSKDRRDESNSTSVTPKVPASNSSILQENTSDFLKQDSSSTYREIPVPNSYSKQTIDRNALYSFSAYEPPRNIYYPYNASSNKPEELKLKSLQDAISEIEGGLKNGGNFEELNKNEEVNKNNLKNIINSLKEKEARLQEIKNNKIFSKYLSIKSDLELSNPLDQTEYHSTFQNVIEARLRVLKFVNEKLGKEIPYTHITPDYDTFNNFKSTLEPFIKDIFKNDIEKFDKMILEEKTLKNEILQLENNKNNLEERISTLEQLKSTGNGNLHQKQFELYFKLAQELRKTKAGAVVAIEDYDMSKTNQVTKFKVSVLVGGSALSGDHHPEDIYIKAQGFYTRLNKVGEIVPLENRSGINQPRYNACINYFKQILGR